MNTHEERLYNMLDDIDTLSDAIKPNTLEEYKHYLKAVTELSQKRHLLYSSDGYAVVRIKGVN